MPNDIPRSSMDKLFYVLGETEGEVRTEYRPIRRDTFVLCRIIVLAAAAIAEAIREAGRDR